MKKIKEILKELGEFTFLDFYDQKDHKISEIYGFMDKLSSEFEKAVKEAVGEMEEEDNLKKNEGKDPIYDYEVSRRVGRNQMRKQILKSLGILDKQ